MSELAININQQMVDPSPLQCLLNRALINELRAAIDHDLSPSFGFPRANQAAPGEFAFRWVAKLQHNHIVTLGGEFQCVQASRFMEVT
jgi:hypothetical protein